MTVTEQRAGWETYRGSSTCPEDFIAVWQNHWQKAVPTEIVRERVPFENRFAVYERLTVRMIDGRDLHARAIHPVGEGPFPVILMFHDQGRGVRGWHHMTRFIAPGYAVVALEHTADLPLDTAMLAQSYQSAFAIAQAATILPYVDTQRMMTWGEGLGGGLAIVTAAMLPCAARCAALNPMPADVEWLPEYLDTANFAQLLKGELLMGTALMDKVAPPQAQFAVFNRAVCPKKHLIYPKYEHERINFFEDELLKFLCI